jgi:hypothetical protein
MSMKKRLSRNEAGDSVLRIEVVGTHDVYRFGWYLTHNATDHAALGRRILRSLRRQVGADSWAWMQRYFHGDGGYR